MTVWPNAYGIICEAIRNNLRLSDFSVTTARVLPFPVSVGRASGPAHVCDL